MGNIDLPDFLNPVTERTFCLFYEAEFDLSAIRDGGVSLEDFGTCGVRVTSVTGDKREICKCITCDSETGNLLGYGIGFDCSQNFLDGVIFNHLEQCATISVLAPFSVPPTVTSVQALVEGTTELGPTPIPNETMSSVTMLPSTDRTLPPTTTPVNTMMPTASGAAKLGFHSMVCALSLLAGVWLFVPYV